MFSIPAELRTPPWNDRTGAFSPLRAVVLALLLVPAALLANEVFNAQLVIPQVQLIYWSGVWATILLLVTLFITPMRRIYGLRRVVGLRRMVGVAALIYTLVHLYAYFWLRFFDAGFILNETLTRFTLIVATLSFFGLVALGLTSFDASIKAMGARNWDRLHKANYIFTGLAVFHFLLSPGAQGGLMFLMVGVYFWLMAWRYFNARRMGDSVAVLAGLTVAATVLTVVLEVVWPALVFKVNPWIILSWNYTFELGLSPGWQMLIMGSVVTLTAWLKQSIEARSTGLAA